MTPERWQKVKEIFDSAIKRPREERDQFLAGACDGDDVLRKEVESLIAADEREGAFIDSPAYEVAADLLVNQRGELQPQQAVGAYEIISFISRGGMGEIYLAQDRRLSRKVALKLLPASFTKDNERLRRFEQEARAASALNHPNIITIYEILKTRTSHLIATEFVEGETLRQRLSRSPLSFVESLHIAIQVADALAAAHKVGIIHRDIKPENIMLRPDGYVKVLDFGLAKLSEQSSSVAPDEALTKQVRTGSGVVMGTVGYMSPEQARGKTVDARSDIFSLGAVIYEMVTQQKPFDGETPSDVLAAILKTDPPPLSQFLADVPSQLTEIVTRTLCKDREERYQVVEELLFDLKSLKQEIEFQARASQSSQAAHATADPIVFTKDTTPGPAPVTSISEALSIEIKRHRIGIGLSILIVLAVIVGGGIGLYKILNREQETHFKSATIAKITSSGKVIDARLSRDGRYLAYVLSDAGKQSIWIRQVSTPNDKVVVPPAPAGFFGLTFSPDGSEIFYSLKANFDAGTLYRVPILGGTPVKLLEKIDSAVTFSPNGKQLAFVRASFPAEGQSALIMANADGSAEQSLAVRNKPERFAPIFFTAPSWSPDGKLIATSVLTQGAASRVLAFPVAGGNEINLTPDPWPFAAQVEWLPDMSGLLVVAGTSAATGAQLWFLSYPSGEKRQITNDLDQHRSIGLTADGTKFVNVIASGVISVWVAREGDASQAIQLKTGNIGFGGGYGNPVTWTPDDKIIFAAAEGNDVNLWIMDGDGENRRALTSNLGRNFNAVVSSDGRHIVFSSSRGGGMNIWRMNIDGSNPKQLTSGIAAGAPAISPDGKWVVYASLGTSRPTIWRVSIDGGQPTELTHRVSTAPVISPDGKFIAYLYPEGPDPLSPPNRAAIIPVEGGEPISTFSIQVGGTVQTILQWSADGKSLLYNTTANNVTNILSQPIDGSPPKQITDFKDNFMTGFAWSRDGKQLVCARGIFNRDAVIFTESN